MKKVLILTHNYPRNKNDRQNAGIFVHDFTKQLLKKNIEVSVVCPGQNDSKSIIENVPVYWFQFDQERKLGQLHLWNPVDLIKFVKFFTKGIERSGEVSKKLKPDFCIAMWAFPAGFFAYLIWKKYQVGYAIWALGSDIYVYARLPIAGLLIKKILNNAKYLFADGIDLSSRVSQISGRKCAFLPSASNFGAIRTKPKNESKSKKIVLTFVGRMEVVKGPDILIDALIGAKDVIENFEVNLIGDGILLDDLKKRVAGEGLGYYLRFYGNISDKGKIAKILSMSNWLIIPSRSDSIPLVFSEAMKTGLPVIASNLPDLKYLINKYRVGLYFEMGNSAKLAAIIRSLKKEDSVSFRKNTSHVAKIFNVGNSVERIVGYI